MPTLSRSQMANLHRINRRIERYEALLQTLEARRDAGEGERPQ